MAVASASASTGIKAPASTFAELLRRSRFASYDPAIAQTYTAPPSYARRGNYGLKRAIPMPYKDSYISLPTFEHHAHFTEWNNAEAQVKFVQRVEEMNVLPRYLGGSTWERGLGEARTQWLIDSEFAEATHPGTQAHQAPPPPPAPKVDTTAAGETLDAYGKQGPGGYGSKRPPPKSSSSTSSSIELDGNHLQLNIESLSPKQFQRYLQKIRQLGPEFRAYLFDQQCARVEAQLRASARAQGAPEPTEEEIKAKIEEDELLLFIASQNSSQKLHRKFLGRHFAKGYTNNGDDKAPSAPVAAPPAKIEAQPHRNGGLTYSHFSSLDSLLTTQPLPGLVLQPEPKNQRGLFSSDNPHYKNTPSYYIALVGGLTAKLPTKNAGVKVPLYKPDEASLDTAAVSDSTGAGGGGSPMVATSPEALERSQAQFRMTRITLRAPPKVVGYSVHKKRPKEFLDEMSLDTECIIELPWSQRNLVNPYRPGSFEYSAHQPVTVHNRMMGVGRYSVGNVVGGKDGAATGAFSFVKMKQKDRENSVKKALGGLNGAGGVDQEYGKRTSRILSGIVNSTGRNLE